MTVIKNRLKVKFSHGWGQWIIFKYTPMGYRRLGCLLFPEEKDAQSTAECLVNLYPELYEMEADHGNM